MLPDLNGFQRPGRDHGQSGSRIGGKAVCSWELVAMLVKEERNLSCREGKVSVLLKVLQWTADYTTRNSYLPITQALQNPVLS